MKKFLKNSLAICLVVVMVACCIPKSILLPAVQAANEEVSEYTYLSFHDYRTVNYDEDIPQNPAKECMTSTTKVQSMDKVVFSGKVTFHQWGSQGANRFSIGGTTVTTAGVSSDFTWHGIGFYANNGKLYMTNYYLPHAGDIAVCNVTLGSPVEFSVQFDKIESGKWKVTYCANGVKGEKTYTNLYPDGNNHSYDFGTYMLILATADSMSLESVIGGDNTTVKRQAVSYDLADGAYLVTGTAVVRDEKGVTVLNTPCERPEIAKPGNYTITTMAGSFPYVQDVSLYLTGDVNLDGNSWTKEDCDALETMLDGVLYEFKAKSAEEKGADINNDGKVGDKDLALLKEVESGSKTSASVLKQYHVQTVNYDYLGGDEVMPIVGYYGPYYGPRANSKSYNFINDEIFTLIKESGINLINYSPHEMGSALDPGVSPANYMEMYQLLALAEKYGIGYYVEDYTLNPERPLEVRKNAVVATDIAYGDFSKLSLSDIAKQIGKYSYYDSYLGVYVQDEPEPNKYATSNLSRYNRQLKFFDWMAQTVNQYTNSLGFINVYPPGSSMHVTSLEDTFGQLDAIDTKVFSYDYYPFAYSCERGDDRDYLGYYYNTDFKTYYEGLWASWNATNKYNKPFWAYVEAGGDFRDGSGNGATNTSTLPSDIETYWNVNNYLAFGAKGIEWFTLLQPWHFALDSTDTVDGIDQDRNGLIGIDGTPTPFYYQAQAINKHIAAIDDVLMKASSKGVYATGNYTVKNLQSGGNSSLITNLSNSTKQLQSVTVSGSDNYGAVVGCFDYRDTEAFYVVNDDMHNNEADSTITLTFKESCRYRYVSEATEYTGSGSTLTLTVGPGEGVLVVLNEEENIYYTDEPNRPIRVEGTVSGDDKSIVMNWESGESIVGSTERGAGFEVYSDSLVLKNGESVEATIQETVTDNKWGFEIGLDSCDVQEGDMITISGTVYPTTGAERGRLIDLTSKCYVWTNGTWVVDLNYYDVAAYKEADATEKYPTQTGKVFSGWFTDSTCETPYTASEGVAYAKFVDAGVMANLAQVPMDTTFDTKKTKMRFVSTVDSLEYSQVGFVLQLEGSTKGPVEIATKNVYKAIVAAEGGVEFTKKPTDIHASSKYFFTYTLTDIGTELFDREIYVTPFWVTLDGTKVYGERKAKTVENGIVVNRGENNDYDEDDVLGDGKDDEANGSDGFTEVQDPESGYGPITR